MIQGIPVTSSNVELIGYDAGRLYVQFKHGGCYRYDYVPSSVYDDMLAAESTGSFINQVIKPQFTATKLGASPFAQ